MFKWKGLWKCLNFSSIWKYLKTANAYKKLDTQANHDPPINVLHVTCNLHPLIVTLWLIMILDVDSCCGQNWRNHWIPLKRWEDLERYVWCVGYVCVCKCVFLRFSIISHVSTRRQAEFEVCAGLGHRLTTSQNWPQPCLLACIHQLLGL
jgi:hypothetical protein